MDPKVLELLRRYKDNACTPEEVEDILLYIRSGENREEVAVFMAEGLLDPLPESFMASVDIQQRVKRLNPLYNEEPVKRHYDWRWFKVAASLLVVAMIGFYIYQQEVRTRPEAVAMDLAPGGNRATLTFANGQAIDLSDDQQGIIIGAEDIKYRDGSSINRASDSLAGLQTLSTPKGGRYQITLPDGTEVWLNAATTLKYPVRFDGPERRVEVEGEAYFEVAHRNGQPFIVSSADQEIKVLGTHFNINTYNDDGAVRTTLLEGSVQVSIFPTAANVLLKPGQQAVLRNGQVTTARVNTDEYLYWKSDIFLFHDKNLKSILLELSRWYDFQVDLAEIPDVTLFSEVPRDIPLSEVLKMIHNTSGIKFKLVADGVDGKERRLVMDK